MSNPKTMKVKPSSEEQGAYVVINEEDFDPQVHEPLDQPPAAQGEAVHDPRSRAKPARKAKAKE